MSVHRRCYFVALLAALHASPFYAMPAQTPAAPRGTLRRVVTTAIGVAIGGTAGYFVGRHFARQSLCAGCSTSVNHDGYLAGGMIVGGAAGGAIAWYLTPASTSQAYRASRGGYLTNAAPDKRARDLRGLRPLTLVDSLAGELGR